MNVAPEVTPIHCLKDNYAYLLRCPSTGQTGVVDPSAAQPILKVLRDKGWGLDYIFNTHHHWDHVGGNEELKQQFPSVRIFGHQSDEGRIPGLTDGVKDGQVIGFGALNGFVIHNPGHTTGAITYVWGDAAFTGDTLFAAGCGRIFEGSPQDMYSSLHQKIGSLPPETRLYFGHEYTEKKLGVLLRRGAKQPQSTCAFKGGTQNTISKKIHNPFNNFSRICYEPVYED